MKHVVVSIKQVSENLEIFDSVTIQTRDGELKLNLKDPTVGLSPTKI